MKFLELTAWAALLLFGALRVDAAELRLEALSLNYASPWQRGTPQQETEDDALLLDAADAGLQLIVPRRTRLLKIEADAYYAKLSQNWQKLYGSEAKISWFEPSPATTKQKWLLCRRPMSDQAGSVFHLSTVVDGRAYSVLLFAPSTLETLPPAALDLLAAMRFDGEPALSATPPVWVPVWTKARTITPVTHSEVLEALIQSDVERLGDGGLVNGYAVKWSSEPGQAGVDWFIEGYQWKTIANRLTQVDWRYGGRLELQTVSDAGVWPVKLTLAEDETDLSASLRVITLCAAREQVADALQQLQWGARLPLERLAQASVAGCPVAVSPGVVKIVQGEPGKTVQTDWVLPLPPIPDPAQLAALRRAGLRYLSLVEFAFHAGPNRAGFGGGLLECARGYVVFELSGEGLQR